MSLCVKSGSCECVFEYKGENPELWLQSVKRVLHNPKFQTVKGIYTLVSIGDNTYTLSRQGIHTLKDRVRLPEFYIAIEKVLTQISESDWEGIEIERELIKDKVRKLWTYACEDKLLEFERQVYEALLQNGNGGLNLETVLERLVKSDVVKTFSQVREALEHLCTLFVVERQHGQFSVRYGVLE